MVLTDLSNMEENTVLITVVDREGVAHDLEAP
ncbi:MAG: hypothetical protein RL092_1326, partial [Bacteroidota bacterium]